jgi:SAM-dependent MidA family methyltransferase
MKSEAEFEPDQELNENTARMQEFIRLQGGSARFDDYMKEHLFGETGYYKSRVNISYGGDFSTWALDSTFAEAIGEFIAQNSLGEKSFIEIAGGEGTFKRNILHESPTIKYLSIDISPKLANMQKGQDTEDAVKNQATLVADALKLPLKDGSIEGTIFSNELFDALPCRVFKLDVDKNGVHITQEGFVSAGSNQIEFVYEKAKPDEFIREYEQFLNERNRDYKSGDTVSAAPGIKKVISETNRVLKSGKALFFDYGYSDSYVNMQRDEQELPYFEKHSEIEPIEKILANPYATDITYSVDFDYCVWIGKRAAPDAKISIEPQHHFFRDITKNSQKTLSPRLSRPSRFGVLQILK